MEQLVESDPFIQSQPQFCGVSPSSCITPTHRSNVRSRVFLGFPEDRAFGLVHCAWSPSGMVRSPTPFQNPQSTHDPSTLADLTNPRRWPMVFKVSSRKTCAQARTICRPNERSPRASRAIFADLLSSIVAQAETC